MIYLRLRSRSIITLLLSEFPMMTSASKLRHMWRAEDAYAITHSGFERTQSKPSPLLEKPISAAARHYRWSKLPLPTPV